MCVQVQPLANRQAFDDMMAELQDLYTAQNAVMPIPAIEELIENATFAAKHPEDLMWYRYGLSTDPAHNFLSTGSSPLVVVLKLLLSPAGFLLFWPLGTLWSVCAMLITVKWDWSLLRVCAS